MIFSRDTQSCSCLGRHSLTSQIQYGMQPTNPAGPFLVQTCLDGSDEMRLGILILLFIMIPYNQCFSAEKEAEKEARTSWPEIVQTPYEPLPAVGIGLKPLLVTMDGLKITTQEAWEKQRQFL